MKNYPLRPLPVAALVLFSALLLCGAPGLKAQTYLVNTFGPGSTQVTTGDATTPTGVIDASGTQWYQNAANLSLNGEGMRIASANAAYLAYFNATPVSIAIPGAAIKLSFEFSTTGAVASSTFKIALLNSQANLTNSGFTRPTLNATGFISSGSSGVFASTASQPYIDWSGYYLNVNPFVLTGTATQLQFFRKATPDGTGVSTSFLTNNNSITSLNATVNGAAGSNLAANVIYRVDFTITYASATALGLDGVVTRVSDGTVMHTVHYDLTGAIPAAGGTSFDTIAFNPNATSGAPGWTFDNISVSVSGAATPPTITTQPLSPAQAVAAGGNVTFTVAASGDGVSYQWQKKPSGGAFANIAGATSASLTLTGVTPANAGDYQVIVTNAGGSVTSNTVTLAVVTSPPAITAQPFGATLTSGWTNLTLSVTAASTTGGTLSYQWQRNGANVTNGTTPTTLSNGRVIDTIITGATGATFQITNIRAADAGAYTVIVTDSTSSANQVTSATANVTVTDDLPVITAQSPATIAVTPGGRARLFFNITGSRPLTIQWKRNGTPIPGFNGSSFTSFDLDGVTQAQAGTYTVDISNAYGTATFAPVTLSLATNPDPLDTWHWANPDPQGNNLLGLASGNGLLVAVGRGGSVISTTDAQSGNVGTSGNANSLSEVVYDPASSQFFAAGGFSTVLTSTNAIAWTNRSLTGVDDGYTGVAANGTGTVILVGADFNVRPNRALVRISTNGGAAWSLLANVPAGFATFTQFTSVAYGQPSTTGHFVAVGVNGNAFFSADNGANWTAIASGTTQTFQRIAYGNGQFVAVGNAGTIRTSTDGETFVTRTSNTTQPLYGVTYLGAPSNQWVAVGAVGTVLTSPDAATWTVTTLPNVGTDLYTINANASIVLVAGRFGRLLTTSATTAFSPANLVDAGNSVQSDWANFTNYVDWDGTSGQFIAVASNGNIHTAQSDGRDWNRRAAAPAVLGFLTQWTRFGSRLLATSINTIYSSTDNAATWTPMSGGAGVSGGQFNSIVTGNNQVVAVGNAGVINVSTNGTSWTAATSGVTTILKRVAYANGRYVAVGGDDTGGASITILTSDNGTTWTRQTAGTTGQLSGVDYANGVWLAVGSANINGGGSFALRSTDNGVTWTRVEVPGNNYLHSIRYIGGRWLAVGSPNVLAVSTDNGLTWNYKSLPAVPNTTTMRGVATSPDAVVIVGNDSTVLTSAPLPPTITLQPASAAVSAGASYTLSVSAMSAYQLSYQWRFNGTPIAAATGPTYMVSNFQSANAGTYDVVVTGTRTEDGKSESASTVSAPAVLTLAVAPVITAQPVNTNIVANSPAGGSLSVTATPATGLTYQWRKFGQPIQGATSATLSFNNADLTAAGLYDVVITNGTLSTTSQAAQVNVGPATYPGLYRPKSGTARFENAGSAAVIIPTTGGGFYALGKFTTLNGAPAPGIARFLSTGAVDTSYTPTSVSGSITAAVLQPDGKLVIAGTFHFVGGASRNYIARLTTTGSLDATFNPGTGFNSQVNALGIQTDGKIVAGGSFNSFNGTSRSNFARLNADGSLDTGFGNTTATFNNIISVIAIQGDGKIVVGGNFTTFNGAAANYLARFNTDGTIESTATFNPGTGFNASINALLVDANGGIVVGGNFSTYNGVARSNLARITASGALDTAFLPTNAGPTFAVNALARDPANGTLLVSGYFGTYGGVSRFGLARVSGTDGSIDQSFSSSIPTTPAAIAILTDGKVVASGNWISVQNATHRGLAKFASDGTIDAGLTASLLSPGTVNAITPVAGGQWVVGGNFTFVNDLALGNVARLNADGTLDSSYASGTGFNNVVNALVTLPDGKLLAGGIFNAYNGVTIPGLTRLNTDGTRDATFNVRNAVNSNVGANPVQIVLQPDGRIVVVGNVSSFDGTTSLVLRAARFQADGLLDLTYASIPTGNGVIYAVRGQPDGRILVGGTFTAFNGLSVNNIARLNADGTNDTAFNIGTGFNSQVDSLALQSDGRIVAGGFFSTFNGTSRAYVASLNANGTLDPTFAPTGTTFNNYVAGVSVQTDAKILVFGYFNTYGTFTRNLFARVNANGTLDTTFTVPTAQVSDFLPSQSAMVSTAQGNILVGSTRFDFTEGTFAGLVLLEPAPAPAITTQPVSKTANGGDTVTFSVTGTGENLGYQWFKDGAAISTAVNASANSANLTLTGVTAANTGSYYVVVTNLYGSQQSSAVTLSGNTPAPTITQQPANANLVLGTTATLTVGAAGNGTLAYQWRKFGTPIAGATSATLTLGNVTLADAGLYDVIVANGLTTLASGVAQVNTVPAAYPNVLRPKAGFNARLELVGNASVIIPIAGGGFYALGNFTRIDGTSYNGVARFLASGAPDGSFTTPTASGVISAAAVQADGKLVIGGSFRVVGNVSRNFIARLNADGTLDTGFSVGSGFNSNVLALAVQPDGKIVAGGSFTNFNGTARLYVARLNSDGSLDTSFGLTTGFNGNVNALALQSDGKVLAGGLFNSYTATTTTTLGRLARLNADGTLDTAFATASGTGFNSSVLALALDASGKIIAGGQFTSYNSTARFNLARVNADGSLDTTFLPTNAGPNTTVNTVALDATGRILIGGNFSTYASVSRPFVTRVSATDGAPDGTFSATQGVSSSVSALAVLTDGKIAIGGSFLTVGGATHQGIAKLASDGTVDTAVTAGLRQPGTVNAVLPLANGQWIVGGNFAFANGTSANNLARLNADGSLDTAYATTLGTGFNSRVDALAAQPDGKVYVGGEFSSLNGTSGRNYLVRLNADGTLDAAFSTAQGTGLSSFVFTLALQADGKLLAGGSFSSFNSVSTGLGLLRLNADGTRDTGFAIGTGFNQSVNAVRVQTDGKILAGGFFTSFNGTTVGDIVRLNADGTPDTAFVANSGTGFNSSVYTIVPQLDGRILVGGAFTTYNGTTRSDLASLNANGTLDTTYAPTGQFNNSVYSVLPQSDGKIVALGNFTSFGGSNRTTFARANANGTIDTSFSLPTVQLGLSIPTAAQLTYLADGSLLASGTRYNFNEGVYSGLVLLEPAPVPAITTAPAAQTADPGTAATFTVTATGENLQYQWLKNGAPIAGATTASYTINSVQIADYASYTVTVSNAYGSVTSVNPNQTNLAPVTPILLDQPTSRRAVAGGKAQFRSSAVGSGTLTYTWRKGPNALTGANASGSDLTLDNLTAADAGTYSVVVSNGTTSVTSQTATLTVLPADNVLWQQFTEWSSEEAPSRLVHDGQGKVYVPWTVQDRMADMIGGKLAGALVRLNETDGSYDSAFRLDASIRRVSHVIVLPDGKLLVSGNRADVSTVVRVTATGEIDPTFSAPAFVQSVRFITRQPDGRIIVAAVDNAVTNPPNNALSTGSPSIWRLNADGTVDSSFSTATLSSGAVVFGPPVLDSSGRIYLAGSFSSINGNARTNVARLLANGSVDASFASAASLPAGFASSQARGVALQSDGRAVFVGDFRHNTLGSAADPVMAIRFTTGGALDTTFASPLRSALGVNSGLRLRYLVMNGDDSFIAVSNRLVRFSANGAPDTSFVSRSFDRESFWVTRGSDGRLYVPDQIGVFGQAITLQYWGNGIAVFAANGTPDESFQTGGWGRSQPFLSGTVLSDGRAWVAGNFNRYGATALPAVAQFSTATGVPVLIATPAGGLTLPYGTSSLPFASVTSAGNDKTYVLRGDNAGNGFTNLVRLDANGVLETGYTPAIPSGYALGSATPYASPDGKLVLAQSSISAQAALNGNTGGALLRLNADGSNDATFTAALSAFARVDRSATTNAVTNISLGGLRVAQILPDGRMLVIVSAIDGNLRLLRLTATGAVDSTFNSPSFGTISPSVGLTGSITDPVTNTTAQFNLTNYGSSQLVTDVEQLPNGKVYVAGRFYLSGQPNGLARLNADGSVDGTFTGSGLGLADVSTGYPYLVDIASDSLGYLYLAGRFDNFNGAPTPSFGLLRLRPDGQPDTSWQSPGFGLSQYPTVNASLTIAGSKLYVFGSTLPTGASATAYTSDPYRVVSLGTLPAVAVTSSPVSQTIIPGNSLTLGVGATAAVGTVSYQWRLNGTPIAGANSATYTVPSFGPANAGTYDVVLTVGTFAPVTSGTAVVTAASPQSTYVADPAFTRPMFRQSVAPNRITVGPDGKYYATWINSNSVGAPTGADHQRLGTIIRLNTDGTLDASFKTGAVLADALAIAFQADGKFLVGGVDPLEGNDTGDTACRVFRLNADGTRDSTYNSPSFSSLPRFMTLLGDGRLYVVPGNGGNGNGISTLARLLADGSLDPAFQMPFFDNGNFIFAPVLVDGTGRLVVAGTFHAVNGTSRPGVARLLSSGQLDTAFAPSGFNFPSGQIRGVAFQTQGNNAGKVLIAGGTLRIVGDGTNTNRAILRLNADGSLDATFAAPSQAAAGMTVRPRLLRVLPDDTITIVGSTVARFTADGATASGFTRPTLSADSFWFVQHSDGRVVFTADVGTSVNGAPAPAFVRLLADGTVDPAFTPPSFQTEVYKLDVSAGADSRATAIGAFNSVNGVARAAVARFNTDGTLAPLTLSGVANLIGADGGFVRPDGKFIIGAQTGTNILTASGGVNVFNADGTLDTTFALDQAAAAIIQGDAEVKVLADSGLLLAANGAQQVVDGSAGFVRVNADGSRTSSFVGIGQQRFGAVYRDGSNAITQIVKGEFRLVGVYPDGRALVAASTGDHPQNASSLNVTLYRTNVDGTPDFSFVTPVLMGKTHTTGYDVMDNGTEVFPDGIELDDHPYHTAIVQPDGKILVGGSFTSFGGVMTHGIARLNADGTVDQTFSVGTGGEVRRRANNDSGLRNVNLAPDGKIWVTGVFDTFNGYAAPGLVRLNTDGSVDTGFATDVAYRSFLLASDGDVQTSVAVAPDGSVYLAGSYAKGGDVFPYALTRLVQGATAPVITRQPPATLATDAGKSVTLSVLAGGNPAPTYQWFKGTTLLSGATDSSYTIASPVVADAGSYTVRVTNSEGTVTSTATVLTVTQLSQTITFDALTPVTFGDAAFPLRGTASSGLAVSYASSNPAVATVSDNIVTIVGAGQTTITASQAGSAIFLAAASVPQVLTVNKAVATVTLGSLSATFDGATHAATATTTPTGLTVTLTYNAVATLPLNAGSYAVAATVSAANYTGSATGTLVIAKASQAIAFAAPATKTFGDAPYTLTATAGSGLPVTFASSNPSVASVNGNTVTILAAGTTTLTASQAGNANFNPAQDASQPLTVAKAVQSIAFTAPAAKSVGDAPYALTATATSGLAVTFASSNPSVATVSGNTVTIVAPGTTTLTASQPGNANYGAAADVSVTLTVSAGPVITTQPASVAVNVGQTATFSVVATGTPTPTYQWRKGTAVLTGQTGATLVLANVQTSDAGSYTVEVTNSAGSVTSSAAVLTVNTAPVITTVPASQTVGVGSTVTFTVAATGTPTPTFQWKKNGVPIPNATNATLRLVNVTLDDAGSYSVTVTNSVSSIDSAVATLTVNTGPAIITQPANTTVNAGQTATFTVVASGTPTPTYQWQRGTTALTGATGATLTIPNVQPADAGSYSVVVTNSLGTATSNAATLSVNTAPVVTTSPASQTVTAGASVTFRVIATGTPAPTYQWQKNGANLQGATDATLTLNQVQTSDTGIYTALATNSVGSAQSAAATLTVNLPAVAPSITAQPVGQTVTVGTPVTLTVGAGGTAPLSFQWKRNGADLAGSTNATLVFASPQEGNSGDYSVVVTNAVGSVTSAVATLTVNPLPVAPSITAQPVSQTVIAGNNAVFIVTAAGSAPLTYQWRKDGAPVTGATSAILAIANAQSANAGTYTVVVTNAVSSVTSAAATLTVNAAVVAPTITAQPAGQTVTAGTAVTFTVAAGGTAPLTYQWQRNGTAIANATSATFTLSSPQVADSGSYNVVVANSAGTATSNTAALTVNPAGIPPAVTTAPVSQAVTAGASVTFTVAATGTAPLAYQWLKNGAVVANATTATLALANVQDAASGSYSVRVSNSAGDVTSSAATLTVRPAVSAPEIGGSRSVAVQLNTPLSYQIQASNSPASYAATGLPTGLTVSATGLIDGTPTVAGVFGVALSATNAGGTGTATLVITVVAPVPVISSGPSASGRVDSLFGYTITASNSPTSFAATGLPDGVTLNAGGLISGTPTTAGTYTVALTATNEGGTGAPFLLTIRIAASVNVPVVTSLATVTGKVRESFVYAIEASNTPTSFGATGLPAGLTLDAVHGFITGSPTDAGAFTMNVSASNAAGTSTPLSVLVTIAPSATAPVISSSTSDTATVGALYSYQIRATNTPTSFAATGLPDGLTVNASGLISGRPTTAGTSAVLLSATNAGGTGSAALLLTVVPGLSAPRISSSPSASGTAGVDFEYRIAANNAPTVFTASTLPEGLRFSGTTGIISGRPSVPGTFTVTLLAGNAAGNGDAFTLTIVIASAAQAPVITSDATASGTQRQLFTYRITASNGPLTGFGATGLPEGLTLDPINGTISGTPSTAVSKAVIVTASNAAGTSAPLGLLITIQPGAESPAITSSLTADATYDQLFTYLITASNMPNISPLPAGNGFSATGLPGGLALNPANGIIVGKPAATGTFNVVLTATNDAGTSAAKTLVITVRPAPNAPSITSGDTAAATAGAGFTYRIVADGSPTRFDAAGRPAWLSIDTATGILSGTPNAPGTYTARLTATSAVGSSAVVLLTITVNPAAGSPVITSSLTKDGIATGAFSYQIGAGPGPITGYLVGTDLPDGLSLDSTTGIIGGRPTIPGTYSVPISAVNAVGIGGAKVLVITIAAAPGSPIVGGPGGSDLARRITGDGRSALATTLTTTGIVNVPFAYQIVASNNPSGYIATGLPAGLALNPGTGLISGLPSVAGTFTVQVGATNIIGVGATTPLILTILPPPSAPAVTSALTASGTAGAAFAYQMAASNTPTSFNATGLPAGTALNSSTGAIGGTPTVPGTYHVSLSANNNVGTGAIADLVVTIAPSASAPAITSAATASGTVGAAFTYQVVASNTPTGYSATGLPPGIAINATTGAVTGTPALDGTFTASVTASNAAGASSPFTLTVTVAPSAATSVINSATTATFMATANFAYVIGATNSPVSYNVSGLPAGLTAGTTSGIISGTVAVPGTYTVQLSANNLAGTGPVKVLTLTVTPLVGTPEPQPSPASRVINLSGRGYVGTGDKVFIAGFVITGNAPKPVLIRAVGPSLVPLGVTGALADPVLELYKGAVRTDLNDNWGDAGNDPTRAAVADRVGAFRLPIGSLDSMIYVTLQPGLYSTIVSGKGLTPTGVALVEVYDASEAFTATTPRLVNISARAEVKTGENILIAGFVISGSLPRQVMIRAVGPTLAEQGVSGVLADPRLFLFSGSTLLSQNDNWGSSGDSAQIAGAVAATGAFPLAAGTKDSVILVTLQPGVYSAQVSGVNNTTGVALVEIYEVPDQN